MIRRFAAIFIAAVLLLSIAACTRIEDAIKDAVSDGGSQTDSLPTSNPATDNSPTNPPESNSTADNALEPDGNSSDDPSDAFAAQSDVTSNDDNGNDDGNNDGNDDGTSGHADDIAVSGTTAAPIRWLIDGTYSFDYVMMMFFEGFDDGMEMSGSIAVDDDKMASTSRMSIEGIAVEARAVHKDGKIYVVDNANKFIMEVPPELEDDYAESMQTDYSGIVKTGEGTGEINGRTLPYEEYAENGGLPSRFYLDGGSLYAIETASDGIKIIILISNMSGSVPPGTFDLPSGYMTIDLGEINSMMDFMN